LLTSAAAGAVLAGTSSTGMLPAHDPVVRRITERAAHLTGYPYANVEPLQLVKYTGGQKYEPHFDYGEACDFEENAFAGHRHVTMLVYLNSVPPEHEGFTTFPKLNLSVSPIAHDAVVFNDCLPNGQEDPRTLHGGSPPKDYTKIAINIWIRAQSRAKRGLLG
jgi:prolyl 4-hydroxylase